MLLGHKIFFCASKCCRLPKFSVKSFLSNRTTVLNLTRCTATLRSPSEVTIPCSENLREFGRPYFMQYLLDNPHKYSVVNTDQINLEDETNFQSLKLLKAFLDNPQETEISTDLLNCLGEEFEICGVDEICKFILLFAKHGDAKKISKPINLLNKVLLRRNLSDEDTLRILWIVKESFPKPLKHAEFNFFFKAIKKLCFKISRLNPQQVAELFLYVPKFHPNFLRLVKFPIQEKLTQTIPELNAEEFAMVADGFLRSELPFTHPELPCVIINKAIKEFENMNDILLNKVSKLLEFKLRFAYCENLMDFQEKIIPHISKFNEATLVRLILTSTQLRCIHTSLWEVAADIFKNKMENLKLSQIEKLLYATTIYNIHDEELLSLAVKHVNEKIDIKYHDTLINILYHLAHHKLYPEDLLGLILSEDFISQFDPDLFSIDLKYKFSFLNCCVELDKPKCNLYFLNQEERKRLFRAIKIRGSIKNTLQKCRISIKKIMNVLEDLYGKNTVCEANCLPHYESGIVMKFDRNLKAQTFDSNFETHLYAKEAINDNDVFSVFIMVLPMDDFLHDGKTLILPGQTRVRQLRGLGYKSVMIKNIEWLHQVKERNEFNFIKELMEKNLKDLL